MGTRAARTLGVGGRGGGGFGAAGGEGLGLGLPAVDGGLELLDFAVEVLVLPGEIGTDAAFDARAIGLDGEVPSRVEFGFAELAAEVAEGGAAAGGELGEDGDPRILGAVVLDFAEGEDEFEGLMVAALVGVLSFVPPLGFLGRQLAPAIGMEAANDAAVEVLEWRGGGSGATGRGGVRERISAEIEAEAAGEIVEGRALLGGKVVA